MSTLYDILEVSEKASDEVIEKAYKTLVKKYHPDLQSNPEEGKIASEKMKEINAAYDVLGNPTKRQEYDAELESKREQQSNTNAQTANRNTEYQNTNTTNQNAYNQNAYNQNANYQEGYQQEKPIDNWRDLLRHLTNKERRKVTRKIERDAKKEYQSMYREYLRRMGYRVKPRVTLKGICAALIFIAFLILLGWILWIIPGTHNYFVEMYTSNKLIKILVDCIYAILHGIFSAFKGIFTVSF